MCAMGPKNLLELDKSFKGSMHQFTTALALLAKEYDMRTENLLDKYMCTETCPCYAGDYYKYDESGNAIEQVRNQEEPYYALTEAQLLEHKRARGPQSEGATKYGFESLLWKNNKAMSFHNFKECFERWETRASSDSSVDLYEVFGLKTILETN